MNIADRIVPGLWQGSAPLVGTRLPFDLVVLCAMEYQLRLIPRPFGSRALVLRVPMDDSDPVRAEDKANARQAAQALASWHARGARVLVTCAQGRNRSGAVVALTLVSLGVSPERAVQLVKRGRGPTALTNPAFVDLVLRGRTDSWAA